MGKKSPHIFFFMSWSKNVENMKKNHKDSQDQGGLKSPQIQPTNLFANVDKPSLLARNAFIFLLSEWQYKIWSVQQFLVLFSISHPYILSYMFNLQSLSHSFIFYVRIRLWKDRNSFQDLKNCFLLWKSKKYFWNWNGNISKLIKGKPLNWKLTQQKKFQHIITKTQFLIFTLASIYILKFYDLRDIKLSSRRNKSTNM